MFCKHCGAENPAGAKFCWGCGVSLQEADEKSRSWETNFIELLKFFYNEKGRGKRILFEEQPRFPKDSVCSYCGSEDHTQIIQKNTTDVKTKGYSMGNGCCGLCLLGPFGLLCGMIGTGTKVKVSSETWWHCKNCGNQYISQASVLEKADAFINGLVGNAFVAGVIYSLFYYWGFENRFAAFLIMIALSVLFPLGMMMMNYDFLNKELGYSIIDILPTEKRKKYWKHFFEAMVIIVAATLLFVPVMELFI